MQHLLYSSNQMYSSTQLIRQSKMIFDKITTKQIDKAIILRDGRPQFILLDFEKYEKILAEYEKLKTKKQTKKQIKTHIETPQEIQTPIQTIIEPEITIEEPKEEEKIIVKKEENIDLDDVLAQIEALDKKENNITNFTYKEEEHFEDEEEDIHSSAQIKEFWNEYE